MSGYRCPLRGKDDKDDREAAAPPLSDSRRAGYGAAPPASRVLRIAARRPAAAPDPAASAAPGGQRHGQTKGLPPTDARRSTRSKKRQDRLIRSLYGFRGLPDSGRVRLGCYVPVLRRAWWEAGIGSGGVVRCGAAVSGCVDGVVRRRGSGCRCRACMPGCVALHATNGPNMDCASDVE
jgi:hypothetical protein